MFGELNSLLSVDRLAHGCGDAAEIEQRCTVGGVPERDRQPCGAGIGARAVSPGIVVFGSAPICSSSPARSGCNTRLSVSPANQPDPVIVTTSPGW